MTASIRGLSYDKTRKRWRLHKAVAGATYHLTFRRYEDARVALHALMQRQAESAP